MYNTVPPFAADTRTQKIRDLNDQLRIQRTGGKIVVTAGIQAEGPHFLAALLQKLAAFDDFGQDNDPWGEHDCATLEVYGVEVIWKVDYFDHTLIGRSADPGNPALTLRVLTIMRADEY